MANKPRQGRQPKAESPSAPPSLRNGRKKNVAQPTRRKSRFEQLEDRRVLAAFGMGDIVVNQINATSSSVTGTVNLHEYTTTGTSVQTLALPGAVSGSNQPLTLTSSASSGGLSLSANGAYLAVGGYDLATGGTVGTATNTTIGLVKYDGTINTTTTTSLLAGNGNTTRNATTLDGTSIWTSNQNGVVYEPTGTSMGGTLVDANPNGRELAVVPQADSPTSATALFASTNKGSLGVQDFSPGLPTASGATDTVLNGMTSATAPSTYAFFFANPTTMFVADTSDGIQEWTETGGVWGVAQTLTGSYVGLTGVQAGNTVTMYATTGTSAAAGRVLNNSLVSDVFTFTSGMTGPGTFAAPTNLASAGASAGFGGVAFAPQAPSDDLVVSSSPSSTMAGNAVTITVTAKNTLTGLTDTSYTGSALTMSSTDPTNPSFTLMSDSGGVLTYSVTLKTAGTQTITATDPNLGQYSTNVSVTPAALYKLGVSAPIDATSGIAFSVTVSAEDQYGNVIPGYLGTVSFSGGGAGATRPSSYTFVSGDNGSHTFTSGVTLVAGSATGTNETITATDSGNAISGSATIDDYVVSPFTAGDFVVYRVGSGSTSLGGESDPVYLDEYNSSGTLIETDPMPVTASGANNPLTGSGNALSEGELTLSPNGEYLAVPGYDTGINYPGTLSVASSTAIPRTVGIVGPSGSVNTTTALTDFSSGDNFRSAITTNGTDIWVSGNSGGVAYTTVGSSTSLAIDPSDQQNVDQLAIVDGQLYVASKKVTGESVLAVGTGLPNAPSQTLGGLPSGSGTFVGSELEAADSFFLTQLNPLSTGPDTLYLADSLGQNGDGLGDVEKWSLEDVSGTEEWVYDSDAEAVGVTGVTGTVDPSTGNVTIYATTSGTNGTTGTLYKITDTTATGGSFGATDTSLITAATNEAFRGVAMVPQAPTPVTTATHFVISAPSTAIAGTPFSFTVTPEDANGNTVAFAGTVTFSSSDTNGSVALPGQYTFSGTGAQTFMATLITAGTQTIQGGGSAGTQTIQGGDALFGNSNQIKVLPAAPHTVVVTAPSSIAAGIDFGVTVAVEDQYGNLATNYTGTVSFTSSDGGANVPANYTFTSADAGTHTFTGVTLSTAGGSADGTNETITATDSGNSIHGSATVGDYVVAGFTAGDIVVTQINAANNTVTPTGSASPVYLAEYNTSGSQSSAVATVPLPSGSGSSVGATTNSLTLSGTAASEGGLSLSADGAYLVLAGYDTAAGGNTQNNSTIGLVSSTGAVNTSTTTTLLSGNNTRSAASVNGTSVYAAGNNGIVYETTGTSLGGTLVDGSPNAREVEIAPAAVSPTSSNQLYASTNKGSLGVQSFTPPLPTATGASNTVLNGMTGTNAPNTYAYFFANPTTMFVADANDGIQEWTLTSGTWSEVATSGGSYVGITGVQTGNTVDIYATTGTSAASGRVNGNSLVSDVFSFNSGTTGTGTFAAPVTLATAGANDGFGGVAFAPQAAAITPVVTTSGTGTAGTAQTITVTATYASGPMVGDTDTSYTGTIHFTSSDPNAALPADYTFNGSENGVQTFSVTPKTAGSQTITATDTGTSGTSSATIAVSPASAYTLVVSAPAGVNAGIAFSVIVTAYDQYGNVATGYTGTVGLNTVGSPTQNFTGDNGTYTFTNVTLSGGSAAGTPVTIAATDSGNDISGSASVEDYTVSNFTSNDLVVEQINGAGNTVTPTGSASPVFLSEYATTGSQSSAVETLALPSGVASGSTNPLTLSGTGASEGALSLSANGKYLVLAGYDTAAGGTTQGNTTVGLVNGSGVVDTSTTTTLLSGNNTRGAASVDGTSVWVAGANGVVYETDGSSGGTLVGAALNGRAIEVIPAAVSPTGANQLFTSTDKTYPGVQAFSPALPTMTGATSNVLYDMSTFNAPEDFAYFFANPTTMFVADANEGIEEWSLTSGNWSNGTWSNVATLPGSYVGLTGVQAGSTVNIYATTGTSAAGGAVSGNSLVSDTFTFNSGMTGIGTFGAPTTLATAGADDSFAGVSFAPAGATIAPPVVTPSGTTQTYTLGGLAKTIDSGISVTSSDATITGATVTINNDMSGDTLGFSTIDGVSASSNTGGVLTLTGNQPAASYAAALASVTFSTTATSGTARSISVVAYDSNDTGNVASNSGAETVNINIPAPVVTANQAAKAATVGQTVTVDSAVTVTSFDANVTGATVTITNAVGGDTLHYTAIDGVTVVSNTGGVLTLTGNQPASSYAAALQTVTFSNTSSTSTTTRNVTIAVQDSNDTGNVAGSASTTITLTPPITITAAYLSGTAWTSAASHPGGATEEFEQYLSTHSLGSATLGYNLQDYGTFSGTQTTPLPWGNINQITVTFSGTVSASSIGLGSLKLVGGTGSTSVAAPSVSSFTSDGSNTYTWTLSGPLGNNKFVFAIATTGSSFGTPGSTQVVDGNGAGISGTFTTGNSLPSGNGYAGSTFDYFFNVMPGDVNHTTTATSAADITLAKQGNNQHETSATYNPYIDFLGAGVTSAADVTFAEGHNSLHNNTLTGPTAPSASQVGTTGSSGFTALALGVLDTGTSSSSTTTSTVVSNVIPASSSSTSTAPASSSGTSGTGSSGGSSTTTSSSHGHHKFAANDEAVGDFDLADLYV